MSVGKLKSEKEFLIELALHQFNLQYKKNIKAEVCAIRSIKPGYGAKYGYEIDTIRTDDYVRLRMYFNLEGINKLKPYRLEVDKNFVPGQLDDEVYVTVGTVNPYYLDAGIYKFRWINEDLSRYKFLMYMNGNVVETQNSGYLKLVNQGV